MTLNGISSRLGLCTLLLAVIGSCQPPEAPPARPKAGSATAAEPVRPTSRQKDLGNSGKDANAQSSDETSAGQAADPADNSAQAHVENTVDQLPTQSPDDVAGAAASVTDSAKAAKVMLGSPELTAGLPGSGKLTRTEIESWLSNPRNHEILAFELPQGLAAGADQVKGIDKNPLTRAKIELGRQLYFDTRLSVDVSISCASCHDPDEGYSRHTQFGVGIKQLQGGRNSPVAYNRILSDKQFWDGRADSLEDQAIGPIANAIEMGNTHEACILCLKSIKGYRLQFEKIFGKLDIFTVGMALASFERAIVTGPSPFDYNERFRPLEKEDPEDLKEDPELFALYEQALKDVKAHPMSESAKRGREIYFSSKGNCSACHVGANLTDELYHNIGVGMDKEKPDLGRSVFTMQSKDNGAFKTPTIRNVALSAPYMHDGSIGTIEEVVEWYAKGGHPNRWLDEKMKKLDLTAQDKKDLVEFMKACTGEFPKVARGRLPE